MIPKKAQARRIKLVRRIRLKNDTKRSISDVMIKIGDVFYARSDLRAIL